MTYKKAVVIHITTAFFIRASAALINKIIHLVKLLTFQYQLRNIAYRALITED